MNEGRNLLIPSGAYQGEMENLSNSNEDELDRLLKGPDLAPGGEPDGLAAFVASAQAEFINPPEGIVETRHLAVISKAIQLSSEKGEPATSPASKAKGPDQRVSGLPNWRRRIMLSELLSTLTAKIVAGTMVAAAATGGMAAAGVFPDPAQQAISDVADNVGISLPSPEREAAEAESAKDSRSDSQDAADGANNDSSMSDTVKALKAEGLTGCDLGQAVSAAARAKGADNESDKATENQAGKDPCEKSDGKANRGQVKPTESEAPGESHAPEADDAPEANDVPEVRTPEADHNATDASESNPGGDRGPGTNSGRSGGEGH